MFMNFETNIFVEYQLVMWKIPLWESQENVKNCPCNQN